MGHGPNQHAYCVKTRKDIIGNCIVSTCRKDTIGKTQYALLCLFGAYCVFSRFPCSHDQSNPQQKQQEEQARSDEYNDFIKEIDGLYNKENNNRKNSTVRLLFRCHAVL